MKPTYGVKAQKYIVLSCCILHNYLIGVDADKEHIVEVDAELANQNQIGNERRAWENDNDDAIQGEIIRDHIATTMWNDYIL